jgi:hypothetical protein
VNGRAAKVARKAAQDAGRQALESMADPLLSLARVVESQDRQIKALESVNALRKAGHSTLKGRLRWLLTGR